MYVQRERSGMKVRALNNSHVLATINMQYGTWYRAVRSSTRVLTHIPSREKEKLAVFYVRTKFISVASTSAIDHRAFMFGATVDIIMMQIHFLVDIDVILTITKVAKRERIELITYFISFREEETLLKFYHYREKINTRNRSIADVFLVKLLKMFKRCIQISLLFGVLL